MLSKGKEINVIILAFKIVFDFILEKRILITVRANIFWAMFLKLVANIAATNRLQSPKRSIKTGSGKLQLFLIRARDRLKLVGTLSSLSNMKLTFLFPDVERSLHCYLYHHLKPLLN